MKAYLADTHIALWLLSDPDKLSAPQHAVLASPAQVWFSVASIWELAIKTSLGKLTAPPLHADTFVQSGFDILDIRAEHAEAVQHLPLLHRDPFDRMLIAQAQAEGLTLLSCDRQFAGYDVAVI